ncbi:(deoxy)nucleoside triphosphate pyrophosphohydrolase [Corynebacterium gerontici]|uniref:8-oxo-dGTP diphosphatase n=1 Tax=Corynebacterium gerontici TaxID=2079234 RepID=A0A3G6J2J2_9CORY|nr:(deoxy)nucleoside triphosphate pyrophosphohydrolase [Corynebacterium gerontici]AZA11188.1 CTP pyrophosphohydrolase [Corynebacterium gerontici]
MKKRIEVTGAVFLRDNLILAAQRGGGKALDGFWEFPGGKIEPGESPEQALARELREELQVDATIGEFLTTTEHEYDFGIVVLSTYFCELNGTEPVLSEHKEVRWVRPKDLENLQWAPADIPAVRLIRHRFADQG